MTSEILHDLGFFGHYLHKHAGGRGGKQFVLATLYKSGGQLPQRDLLGHTCNSRAALSEVLSKLEAEGCIVRRPYEHDRRQLVIELTDLGEGSAARTCHEREEFEANALTCLSVEEREQLSALLSRLKAHWEKLEESEVSA